MKKYLPWLLILMIANPVYANLSQDLEKRFKRYAAQHPSLHGQVLITQGNTVLLNKKRGTDVQDPNTQFFIASITKQFTAAAVLRCVEKGLLDLHAPLSHYFKGQEKWAEKVTLHHLLSHTSVLPDYTNNWDKDKSSEQNLTRLLHFINTHALKPENSGVFHYNNTGYALAEYLVEKVTGQPFDAFLQKEFFNPLNMHHTFFPMKGTYSMVAKSKHAKNLVPGYHDGQLVDDINMGFSGGAGALISTVPDLEKWLQALFIHKTVLKPSSLRAMMAWQTKYRLRDIKEGHAAYLVGNKPGNHICGYGYGFYQIPFRGKMLQYTHGGWIDGSVGDVRYIPTKKLGNILIVGLSNHTDDHSPFWGLINELAGVIYEAETIHKVKSRHKTN